MTGRYLYLVDALVTDAGITADVPDGVSWCGNTDGTTYLILTDTEIDRMRLVHIELEDAPLWQANETVAVGDRRLYNGVVYRCLQAHTTQAGWTPLVVPALWTVARSDGDPWVQPTMAQDAYGIGRIVAHEGVMWSSKIPANTTTPGSDDRWWEQVADLVASATGLSIAPGDPESVWRIGGAV